MLASVNFQTRISSLHVHYMYMSIVLTAICKQIISHSVLKQGKNMIFNIYYIEECVLLGTKPLVDSIRHFIWDPSGIFSVCHLCECHIVQ